MKKFYKERVALMPFWQIAVRFVGEFWMPFLISACWTYWNWSQATKDYDLLEKGIVNFFAAGWVFSQWNRIKKQKRQEDGLSTVGANVNQLIGRLDESTRRMIGSSTGGDSFCEVIATPVTPLAPTALAVLHHGEFPLYDLTVRIIDLERRSREGSVADHENVYKFDSLIPNHMITINLKSPISRLDDSVRRFNIHVIARNGSSDQMLQMRYVNGYLRTASNIEKSGAVIFENIAKDYPKNSDGGIDWEPHFENKNTNYKHDLI